MTFILKCDIENIIDLPTFAINSISLKSLHSRECMIDLVQLKISSLHNLIELIIKNTLDKKILIISILKFNDEVINKYIVRLLNASRTYFYIYGKISTTIICKIIHFKQIKNILHLVIYNNLDIDILLYTLLLLYFIEINKKLVYKYSPSISNSKRKYLYDNNNISFVLCKKIMDFDNYKFDIINTEYNYYDIFLQNKNTNVTIHNNLEQEKLKQELTTLKDEVKIYKNIVNKLILEMEKINQQNDLLEKLKELIK